MVFLAALGGGACIVPPRTDGVPEVASQGTARRAPRASVGPRRTEYAGLRSRVLPSGLLVLLDQDPYAASAGVVSVVTGGAGTEPDGAQGIAHLVEHLTFRAID